MVVTVPNNRTQSGNNGKIGNIVVVRHSTIDYVVLGILGLLLLIVVPAVIFYLVRRYMKVRNPPIRRRLFSDSSSPFYYSSESDANMTLFNGQELVELSSFAQTSSPIVERSVL